MKFWYWIHVLIYSRLNVQIIHSWITVNNPIYSSNSKITDPIFIHCKSSQAWTQALDYPMHMTIQMVKTIQQFYVSCNFWHNAAGCESSIIPSRIFNVRQIWWCQHYFSISSISFPTIILYPLSRSRYSKRFFSYTQMRRFRDINLDRLGLTMISYMRLG